MALYADIEKKLGSFMLKVRLEAGDEAVSLLGASGCGKSLTLKCIAGIERPDRGRIELNDVTLFDSEKGINLPPQERRVGFMFQQGALFPNMNVLENVMCGIRSKLPRREKERVALEMLAKMHLEGKEKAVPATLSGGEQQRVALARILVNEPEILLLDEPFSALDSHLRFELEQVLRKTVKELGKTVIFVSHNRDEAFRITEKIAIMNRGCIDVFGEKKAVFAKPLTKNAAKLTGCKNVADIEADAPNAPADHSTSATGRQQGGTGNYVYRRAYVPDWGIHINIPATNDDVTAVGIRMHDILPGHGENELTLAVTEVVENPFSYTVMLSAGAEYRPLGMELDKTTWERIHADKVTVHIPSESVLLLKK